MSVRLFNGTRLRKYMSFAVSATVWFFGGKSAEGRKNNPKRLSYPTRDSNAQSPAPEADALSIRPVGPCITEKPASI